jgi:GTP cyclohydrolase II
MKHNLQFERILFELNRGYHIILSDNENRCSILFSATEAINENTLNFHKKFSKSFPSILLSAERCRKLNIKTDCCCSISINLKWTIKSIFDLAFGNSADNGLKLNGVIEEKSKLMNLSLQILKKGKFLPSGIFSIINNSHKLPIEKLALKNKIFFFNMSDLEEIFDTKKNNIDIITRAKLPIKKTKDAEIIVFKFNDEPKEYFCILIGKINEKNQSNFYPTVRIHSQCVTGDIFHSLKCDCGEQLNKSIDIMVKNGEGILIYLPQEGRDIGLTNKIRAYKLQENGLDTVDANLTLGFRDDERSYDVAVAILKKLNFKKINLITNNPYKIEKLNDEGLEVMKIIKLKIESNEINKDYLNTKKNKSNHIFD